MTEESLFHEALAKPLGERADFLAAACAGQPELRAAVEALLAAHEASGNPLDRPPAELDQTIDSRPNLASPRAAAAPPGVTVDQPPQVSVNMVLAGRYKIVEQIGEGGMGTVYMAQQMEPVKRLVAVKIIKPGMDSKEVLARFEAERQALALMDHPNIARVLDAGATESGRPYFVMELVKGIPITQYCDQRRFTPRERLELFLPVCQAIQHAHQKGIIHRDIKPSNVLVALYDDHPVPKVIDFGLAKATGRALTEKTLITGFGALVGTPEYMSPEQASLNNQDIDTRCDIYTLGVLLYELLTGSTPVDRKSLANAAMLEVLRIVREVEAPRPSTKLSSSANLPSIAASRGTEPAKLTKLLRGELDWVLLKALEKDRGRRYETANGLARDIQRYLADEVVEARPPSTGYRLWKSVRRHKAQVIAAGLLLLTLLAGIAGTTFGLLRAKHQQHVAEEAQRKEHDRAEGERKAKLESDARRIEAEKQQRRAEAGEKLADERLEQVVEEKKRVVEEKKKVDAEKKKAQAERQIALEETQIALAVQDFLEHKLLGQADVTQQANALIRAGHIAAEANQNVTVHELLARAAEELAPDRIDAAIPNQPRVQAEILRTVGITYRGVGDYRRAVAFLERSLALSRRQIGGEHPETLAIMSDLGAAYQAAGKLDQALPLFEKTLQLQKATLGRAHPATLVTMNNMAVAYQVAGKLDLALPLYEEAFTLQKAKFGSEDVGTLTGMNNLAGAYTAAGKLDLAVPLFEETLKLEKAKLGRQHPSTLGTMDRLAVAYQAAGKRDLALPLAEEALRLKKAKLGFDHPETLQTMSILAVAYKAAGRLDLALPLLEETLKLRKAKLGPDHPETLESMNNLALAYHTAGRLDLALPLYEETFTLEKAKLGPEHPETLNCMNNLAGAYQAVGKLNLALPLFEESLKDCKAKLGPEHPDTLQRMNNLATAYLAVGKLDLALPLLDETLRLRKAKLGPDHPDTLASMNNLAGAYEQTGQLDKSIRLFEETLRLRQMKFGRQHPDTLTTVAWLGVNYKDSGRLAEALPLLEEAHRASKKVPALQWVSNQLLDGYARAGEREKAASLAKDLLAGARSRLPKHSLVLAQEFETVGSSLLREKAFAEAEPVLREALAIRDEAQPDFPSTFYTKSLLGRALFGQKKYAQAEPLLLAGYRGLKEREAKIPPGFSIYLTEALERLVQLYDAWEKKDEATKWRKELQSRKDAATRGQIGTPQAEESRQIIKVAPGPRHPDMLSGLSDLPKGRQAADKLGLSLPLLEKALRQSKAKLGPDHPDTLRCMDSLAVAYLHAGKSSLAQPLLEEALKLKTETLGPEHLSTLESMNNLAGAYQENGKLDLAVPLFEETLKLRKAKLGPDHPDTLTGMNNLANAYQHVGKLSLALPLLEETLKLTRAKLGREHLDTLGSMNNLAAAYFAAGKLAVALPLFEETLRLYKAKLGPDHPYTLATMNNLANAYQKAGKLDLALPLFEETLKLTKAKLGPEHPHTLKTMDGLAGAYQSAGRLDLALPLFEETLKLRKAKLGPEHPETVLSMDELGVAYWKMGRLDKSIPIFEDLLKLCEATFGRRHPHTLAAIANLGVNYKDANRLAEALPLLEEAYRASKKSPGMPWISGRLLDCYVLAGEREKAVSLAEELLAGARRQLPKDSPLLAAQLATVGSSLLQVNAFADAEPLLREALAIRKKAQPDVWSTFNAQSLLGAALLGQKKYGEAEPLLLAGYRGMREREAKFPQAGKVRLTEALERLVQLYDAWEKKDEAAKWRKELQSRNDAATRGQIGTPRAENRDDPTSPGLKR
jgi:eukaryotic-like serine/threonine-protein kinase